MARFLDAPGGPGPLASPAYLTRKERIGLERAPKVGPGTRVTVRSYDVPSSWLTPFGRELPPGARGFSPDHMFVEYDDGRERYIFRGGPKGPMLHAQVTPAQQSQDDGRGERILFQTVLPNVDARQAIRPAQAAARRVNESGQPYLVFDSNSNTAVGDLTEAQFGRRVGDRQTPGHRPPPLYPASSPIL